MNEVEHDKQASEKFLADLRSKTADNHKKLEENKVSEALLSTKVSLADYRTYLLKMYGLVKGIELYVHPLLIDVFPDLAERKQSHLLAADLEHTGLPAGEITGIPVKKFTPENSAEAAGMMYVLEGSTLGGRLIYKHVNKYLTVDAANGASFFSGYAGRSGSMWKEFIRSFTLHIITAQKQDTAIDAATETFNAVADWMENDSVA